MGSFSWITCDTKERIINGEKINVYVLVPEEFGGGNIKETCYGGYGRFGEKDIYDLVAIWNKDFLEGTIIMTSSEGETTYPYIDGVQLSFKQRSQTTVVPIGKNGKLSPPRKYIPLMEHPSEKGESYEAASTKL